MTRHPKVPPWLVVVEHGDGPRSSLDRLLAHVQRTTACHVERVRTDRAPSQVLANPNEALEFSGYQEGLARLLVRLATDPSRDDVVSVVFTNDTLTAGHVYRLARQTLDTLLRLQPQPGRERLLVGLKMPLHTAIRAVSGPNSYVSTWAFALLARPSQLRAVRFYAATEVLSRFAATVQPALPEDYRRWVATWLEPRHFMSGWYKAVPGLPLEPTTRLRKELTIYLEHSLIPRLEASGFEALDIGDLLPSRRAVALAILRRLDKLNVNLLKLRLRVPALLRAS